MGQNAHRHRVAKARPRTILIDVLATKWLSRLVNYRIAEERLIASGTPALLGPDSL